MSPESPILFWFISFEIFSPDTFIFYSAPRRKHQEPGKVGLGGLSLRAGLSLVSGSQFSHLGGEGLRRSLQSLLARRADIYVPVQKGNTGQASSPVPSYSSRGNLTLFRKWAPVRFIKTECPHPQFLQLGSTQMHMSSRLIRLLIIVVFIDF